MTGKVKVFAAIGAAVLLGGGGARADERQSTKSGARQGASAGEASKEITGRVLQAGPSKLYLEHMGAVVEFNLKDTEFSGGDLHSSRDLSEGQQVRASFTVENKTTNVAKRVSLASEAGTASPHEQGPGEHDHEMAPGERPERATPSLPGMPPPREPGTTPPPKG